MGVRVLCVLCVLCVICGYLRLSAVICGSGWVAKKTTSYMLELPEAGREEEMRRPHDQGATYTASMTSSVIAMPWN